MSLPSSPPTLAGPLDTLIGLLYGHFLLRDSALWMRILLIAVLAAVVHIAVKGIRMFSEWVIIRGHPHNGTFGAAAQKPKVITVTRLVVSSVIFGIYFLAVGLVLPEDIEGFDLQHLAHARCSRRCRDQQAPCQTPERQVPVGDHRGVVGRQAIARPRSRASPGRSPGRSRSTRSTSP
jgi:hypothetical protein